MKREMFYVMDETGRFSIFAGTPKNWSVLSSGSGGMSTMKHYAELIAKYPRRGTQYRVEEDGRVRVDMYGSFGCHTSYSTATVVDFFWKNPLPVPS